MKKSGKRFLDSFLIAIVLVLGTVSYGYSGHGTELGPTGPSQPGGGCEACGGSSAKQLGCCQTTPNTCEPQVDKTACDFMNGEFSAKGQCVHAVGPDFIGDVCTTPAPTVITLSAFTAIPGEGMALLTWTTGAEIDNYGFNILRGNSPNGPFEQINPTVIPAMGVSPGGATYTFVDTKVSNGTTYYYRLDDIDNHGMVTAHNVVSATPMFASKPPASEDKSAASSNSSPAESPSTSASTSSSEEDTQAFLYQIVTASGSQLSVARLEPGAEPVAEKKGISFKAKGGEGHIVLEWVARNRDDGYYLWRSEEDEEGAYTQITDFLLPSFDMEHSEQPLKFEYTDASVSPGVTYYYKLEAMDVTGKNHFVAKASATSQSLVESEKREGVEAEVINGVVEEGNK